MVRWAKGQNLTNILLGSWTATRNSLIIRYNHHTTPPHVVDRDDVWIDIRLRRSCCQMDSIPVSRHSAILPKNQIVPLLAGTLCSVPQSFLSFPSTKHFTMRRAFVGSEVVWLWVQSMTWRHLVNILWSSFCNAFCDVSLRKCKDSKLKKKMENWSQTSCVASGNVWVQTLTVGGAYCR